MPSQVNNRDEIAIETQKMEVLDVAREYMKHDCDPKGKPKRAANLTEEELLGKKEILNGINDKNWILYSTDKYGNLSWIQDPTL